MTLQFSFFNNYKEYIRSELREILNLQEIVQTSSNNKQCRLLNMHIRIKDEIK